MIKLPKSAIEFINKNFSNLDDGEKQAIGKDINSPDDIFSMKKINDILDVMSDFLNYHGFDKDDEITDYGREIERIYDDIYYNAEE